MFLAKTQSRQGVFKILTETILAQIAHPKSPKVEGIAPA
jgi:hypothetical protein